MWIGHRKEIRICLRWPIHINAVNKTKLSRYTFHRRSATDSLETYLLTILAEFCSHAAASVLRQMEATDFYIQKKQTHAAATDKKTPQTINNLFFYYLLYLL